MVEEHRVEGKAVIRDLMESSQDRVLLWHGLGVASKLPGRKVAEFWKSGWMKGLSGTAFHDISLLDPQIEDGKVKPMTGKGVEELRMVGAVGILLKPEDTLFHVAGSGMIDWPNSGVIQFTADELRSNKRAPKHEEQGSGDSPKLQTLAPPRDCIYKQWLEVGEFAFVDVQILGMMSFDAPEVEREIIDLLESMKSSSNSQVVNAGTQIEEVISRMRPWHTPGIEVWRHIVAALFDDWYRTAPWTNLIEDDLAREPEGFRFGETIGKAFLTKISNMLYMQKVWREQQNPDKRFPLYFNVAYKDRVVPAAGNETKKNEEPHTIGEAYCIRFVSSVDVPTVLRREISGDEDSKLNEVIFSTGVESIAAVVLRSGAGPIDERLFEEFSSALLEVRPFLPCLRL